MDVTLMMLPSSVPRPSAGHPLGAEDHVFEVGSIEGVPSVLRRLEEGD